MQYSIILGVYPAIAIDSNFLRVSLSKKFLKINSYSVDNGFACDSARSHDCDKSSAEISSDL